MRELKNPRCYPHWEGNPGTSGTSDFHVLRDFVNTRLLVHKHVKISVDEWILKTTRPHKHVAILGFLFVNVCIQNELEAENFSLSVFELFSVIFVYIWKLLILTAIWKKKFRY